MHYNDKDLSYNGYTIEIHTDEDAQNPREEFDNAGTMLCFDRRHNLGDKHSYKAENYKGWKQLIKAVEENEGEIYYLPLYVLEHSGMRKWIVKNTRGTTKIGLPYGK
jgi:hypothetical protein